MNLLVIAPVRTSQSTSFGLLLPPRRFDGPARPAAVGVAKFFGDLGEHLPLLFQFKDFGLPIVGRFDLRHFAARRQGARDLAHLVEFLLREGQRPADGLALPGEVAAGVDMIFDGLWVETEVSGNLGEAVRLRHDGNPSAVNYRTIWQDDNFALPTQSRQAQAVN